MAHNSDAEIMTFPGEYYSGNCLDCYELLAENYGGTKFDKCAYCQLASNCGCRFVVIKNGEKERWITVSRD